MALKTCVLAVIVGVLAGGVSSGGQGGSKVQEEFQALVVRVKQSDPSVSFLQLRRLYAESDTYRPYRDDAEASMIAAAEAEQYETALRIARDVLSRNYLNIEAHFAGVVSCSALGDKECAAHHVYVARGMIDSILASGDGKAPATAFVVVNTEEEYALLRILQVRRQGQALIQSDDGHSYDVLTVRDDRTGEESHLYFNVDSALAAMARVFGLK